jgi:D-aminopeptidase
MQKDSRKSTRGGSPGPPAGPPCGRLGRSMRRTRTLVPVRSLARPLAWALAATLFVAAAGSAPPMSEPPAPRPRLRDLGVSPGVLPPGPRNAITDVEGVRVGHRTLVRGDGGGAVRTGVTAILPHGGNLFQSKVPAAAYVGNGFGKAAGLLQVQELGNLETPIVLTNTLAVGTAIEAVVAWTLALPGNEGVRSVNAVVGETNDGHLNDIRGRHVTAADVRAAVESAAASRPGAPVEEGSVGAGTGTMALGWKGGIGTASRRLPRTGMGGYTVGALVQSNYGGVLTIDGVRVGERLGRYSFREEVERAGAAGSAPGPGSAPGSAAGAAAGDGSCMIVLATDAPLSSRNLERLARRAVLGLARTGSYLANGSGDFVIAFSTANQVPHAPAGGTLTVEELHNDAMSPLFLATVEAVEEAVYNSLLRATDVTGRDGNRGEALPIAPLRELLGARQRPAGR